MKYIIYILFLVLGLNLAAQETRIIVSEDSVMQTGEYDRLFNALSGEKTKITALLKFNAVDWGQLSPSIIYEQQLFSFLTVEPSLRLDGFSVEQQDGLRYMLTPELRFKAYHNFKYREQKGKNINGFSGNYFMVSYLNPISETPSMFESNLNRTYFYNYDLASYENNKYYSIGLLQLGYGLQRRFLNMGYLDIAAGVNWQLYQHNIGSKKTAAFIKIGIGFGLTPTKAKELNK